jgi:hypothetical protein
LIPKGEFGIGVIGKSKATRFGEVSDGMGNNDIDGLKHEVLFVLANRLKDGKDEKSMETERSGIKDSSTFSLLVFSFAVTPDIFIKLLDCKHWLEVVGW